MCGEDCVEAEGVCDVDNTIFVAVGKNLKEGRAVLSWAVNNFAGTGRRVCLLHVHQPTQLLSTLDGKLLDTKLKQAVVTTCQELEQERMNKLMNQYLLFLCQAGIPGDKVCLEMNVVEKGIVQAVCEYNIRWLVMGAAAMKYYSKKLLVLKSNKAIFVCQNARLSCHIWFICSGCLIYTRAQKIESVDSVLPCSDGLCSPRRNGGTIMVHDVSKGSDETSDNWEETSKSVRGMGRVKSNTPLTTKTEMKKSPLHVEDQCQTHTLRSSSLLPHLTKLEHATVAVENVKQRSFEESLQLLRAEADAMEAIREAEASEKVCIVEVKRRKEIEEMLVLQTQELEKLKFLYYGLSEQLQKMNELQALLVDRIKQSTSAEKELVEKIIQAVELLKTFRAKRDKLQRECVTVIRELDGLKKLLKPDIVDSLGPKFFQISFSDITEATGNFDPSLKIGEGNYGSVYKGILRGLNVAIKMLPSSDSMSDSEFEYEAEAMSKVRHPNIVTLIGYCSESRSVVYEYLENGNLEDHLSLQARFRPLPWQYRIRIALEMCSVLIFLHSNSPFIIHGNLKPSNIILDAQFVSKISDLGICCLIWKSGNPFYCASDNHEASIYVDPEYSTVGELTAKSDVYAFGILVLQLLTGRLTSDVVRDVCCALKSGNITAVLDFSAGDWPIEQAKQLAFLSMRCCDTISSNRPDLISEVWPVLEPMKYNLCTLSSDLTSSCSLPKTQKRIPPHFICPIIKEVMEDPCIAADGFTYEADAIKGWFDSGHKTSPMTNLKLEHCDLLPNFALYYAIQEWQQHP